MISAWIRTGFAAAGLLTLAGCHNIDFSGLSDLVDVDPTYLNLPGRRIAEGQFESVSVDGTDSGGAFVVGFDVALATPGLAIFPFGGGPGCRTGPANSYLSSYFSTRSELPLYFPFIEQPSGSARRLHLTGSECQEPIAPIENTGFPLIPPSLGDPPGYLALTGGSDLLFLEPWVPKQTTIATDAHGTQILPDKIWSIEGGNLVARTHAFDVLARFGTNVTEFATTTETVARTAFVDGGALFVVTDDFKTVTQIEPDACKVGFPSGFRGRGLSYYAPCASERLVLYGSPLLSDPGPGQSDQKFPLSDSATGNPQIAFSGDQGFVFFVSNSDPNATNGTLWGGAIGSTLESIAAGPQLDGRRAPIIQLEGTSWRMLVEVTARVGRLIQWNPGATPNTIAESVAEEDDPLAIVNYDGKVGDLAILDSVGISAIVAKGVPRGGIDVEPRGIAAITEFDGTSGTLLASPADASRFDAVAPQVSLKGFGVIQSLAAVAYLHDYDPRSRSGMLGVRVIESGDTFDTGVRASEWVEVGWPQPGLLYVVPNGNHQGIWFAALK